MRTKSKSSEPIPRGPKRPPQNRAPMHPGKLLRKILEEEGIAQEKLAADLGVSFQTVNAIVNERAGVPAKMAVRLARRFDMDARSWLNLQQTRDIWEAERELAEAS